MSKAGQNTFTGISDQADIALFYLLQASKWSNFQKIIVEGSKWEDFTLIYSDHSEDFEVKSYKKPLSFRDIKNIVRKNIKKRYGDKDKFKIVCRKLSNYFKDDYEYIRDYISYIMIKGLSKDSIGKKFLKKNWSSDEVSLLARIEIIEFNKIENIHQQISEYFAYTNPFYFDITDQKSIISQFFKEIMEKGKQGGAITQNEFQDKMNVFAEHIADSPTKFDPKLPKGNIFININNLKTAKELQELNHRTCLSQLTVKPQFIFFLCNRLENEDFHVNDFVFFIEKVLLKQNYVMLALRILEKKWLQNKVSEQYILDFVLNNYKKLSYDFNYDHALKILKDIAQKDVNGNCDKKIIDFLKRNILLPFTKDRKKRFQRDKRGWREDEQIAELLKIFLERTNDKRNFVDFIFDYFDLTSDDFDNVIETHPLIYSFVKNYIKENLKSNFGYVVKKISGQFNIQYNGKYKGYEWIGSGIGGWGTNYEITDKGVVRLLFQPLFLELYMSNPRKAWQFFRTQILEKTKLGATKDNPVYLKRALIPILIERVENIKLNDSGSKVAYKYLQNIVSIKRGIPGTSEIVFNMLRHRDLEKFGFDRIMELIYIDSIKYKHKNYPAGYPTNLFVISTLIKLIKVRYQEAKDFFVALIKKPDFIKYDQQYNTFELLVAEGIMAIDPGFIVTIFKNFDFEKYLNSFKKDIVWDKSGLITGLIKKDWEGSTTRGQEIFRSFLENKVPGEKVLEFLAGPIRDLSQSDPLRTYGLLKPYLADKEIFWKTFQNNSYVRESIVSTGEDLVKNKHYVQAKQIVDLCIADPDPNTDVESQYNYHIKIKNGEKESGITSVRGRLAWVLQKFVLTNEPELMEYAFEKTRVLLDLDGTLAMKLNYKEPDLYVRKQALVPFIELAHPWRRNKLNEYRSGLGDRVKQTAFEILSDTKRQLSLKEAKPIALEEFLVSIFSYIRDLTVEEANQVLEFFKEQKETEAHFLFTYFAEFIKEESFDSALFKKKLEILCSTDNPFKQKFAWEFWITAEDDKKDGTSNFSKIEKYWKLLLEDYDPNVFNHIFRTLNVTLFHTDKYLEHKKFFKKAIDKQITFHITNKQSASLWEPGSETFKILAEQDVNYFLEIFEFMLGKLNDATKGKIDISYYSMKDWINIFKSIIPLNSQTNICDNISLLINDLYPEYVL